jgi:hypothetical protein
VRPIAGRTTLGGSNVVANAGTLDFAQCSPLVGVKLGIAKKFQNDWELAGAAGVAFSLVSADDKVREHEVLVDLEANKYLGGGSFIGTGISLWDITHSDTFTPAWMLHFGVPLAITRRTPCISWRRVACSSTTSTTSRTTISSGRACACISKSKDGCMRFVHLFLAGYFVLVVGVTLALWQTGVLNRVAPIWIAIGAIVAVGIGIMAAVSSGKPSMTKEG